MPSLQSEVPLSPFNTIAFINKVTNKTENLILELIRDNLNITIAQLMIKTNLSEPGVKKNLKKLKEKNMIRRIGANKDGYWEIIE